MIYKTLRKIMAGNTEKGVFVCGLFFWAILIALFQNLGGIRLSVQYANNVLDTLRLIFRIITNFYIDNLSGVPLLLHGVLIVILSLQTTIAVYHVRQKKSLTGASWMSLSFLLTLVGTGCAACSLTLLSALIGTSASVALLSALPYSGAEILVIACLVSAGATLYMLKKVQQTDVCSI